MTTPPTPKRERPDGGDVAFDDPRELADLVAAARRPTLIGLDIDGVLAPIVAHADDSRLLDGVAEAIGRLVGRRDVTIAVVSGRSLASIRTFGLPAGLRLVGGHGSERPERPLTALDRAESRRLAALAQFAERAAEEAGDGAWVEHKPASVVLHVREADAALAAPALRALDEASAQVAGAERKHGSEVLELFARAASKGTAMSELATDTHAATSVFVGDDITDEEVFAVFGPGDIAVKVGRADSLAPYRLPDPDAVLTWLRALDVALAD